MTQNRLKLVSAALAGTALIALGATAVYAQVAASPAEKAPAAEVPATEASAARVPSVVRPPATQPAAAPINGTYPPATHGAAAPTVLAQAPATQPASTGQAMLSLTQIEQLLKDQGLRVKELEVKDSVVEAEAYDANNREVDVLIDRRSGEILSRRFDD